MTEAVTIGAPPWTADRFLERLEEFAELYDHRPIQDNTGGMASPHMFLAWFVLRELRPRVIVESGVWMGQGTWLFEQACPDAKLICIEPYPATVRYRSSRAIYLERDFAELDWTGVPRDETVLFFDDHQNAFERVKAADSLGFRHLLFEDNYPPGRGDCYSLKKVLSNSGFQPPTTAMGRLRDLIDGMIGRGLSRSRPIAPNSNDSDYLRRRLEIYVELPPVFQTETTRWGDAWSDERYPTPEPLLDGLEAIHQRVFQDEARTYTWMCYARL